MEIINTKNSRKSFKDKEELRLYLEKTKNIVIPIHKSYGFPPRYLERIARDEILTIEKDKYRRFTGELAHEVTRTELHCYLQKLAGDKSTGFTDERPPSKKWSIDFIYSVKPDHFIFDTVRQRLKKGLPEG